MASTIEQLEQRLNRVEQELGELKTSRMEAEDMECENELWWKKMAGDVAHPEVYAEIARLGAEIRAQDREMEH